jgi:hypothetical protein
MDVEMKYKDLPRESMERKDLPPNYDTSKVAWKVMCHTSVGSILWQSGNHQ